MKVKVENFKKIKSALDEVEGKGTKSSKKISHMKENDNNDIIVDDHYFGDANESIKLKEQQLSVVENNIKNISNEGFYLEKEVKKIIKENETKRKDEIEKIEKECEKIELKDKKYMESLKAEFLAKYQEEQDRCQKRLENKKKRELQRIEKKKQAEKERVERMCEREVVRVIKKVASQTSWYDVALKIHNSCPEFFENNKNN